MHLGLPTSKVGETIAFLFYDRIVALRTQAISLHSILGRVLAHEIVHVLLPDERHSDFGLMRGQWSTDDLRTDSGACIGLPVASVRLMRKEALRRVASAQSRIEMIGLMLIVNVSPGSRRLRKRGRRYVPWPRAAIRSRSRGVAAGLPSFPSSQSPGNDCGSRPGRRTHTASR